MLKKITVTSLVSLILLMLCFLQNGEAMDDGNSNKELEERLHAVEKRLDEMNDDLTDPTGRFQDFFNTGAEWPMWLKIGAGIRSSFSSVEDAVDDRDDWSQDFELENMRLYINANVTTKMRLVFNTERFNDGETQDDLRVLDAYVAVEFHDLFNVYAGRLHPPSDRTNSNGPFNLNTWQFPFVSAYPSIFAGRDEGIAIWGQVGEGKFKYQLGAFEGRDGGSNEDDDLIYSGRLTFNFWDPEPGYYNKSAYYGTKDVLAIGLVGMFQNHGAGSADDAGDFTGWSIDFLMEKKLANNAVVNLEGAFYVMTLMALLWQNPYREKVLLMVTVGLL
ncbi:MAG: hypothetical protein ACUZ8O_11135 [Candidatus Anammoxibacter sp.]